MKPVPRSVLEQLAGGEALYGLQLLEGSNGVLRRGWLYVELAKLEDAGLIVGREHELDPAGRRIYQITSAGQVALRQAATD